MRIARFNGGRIGIVIGDSVRDVTAAAGVDPAEWPPVGMVRVIANFSKLGDKLAAVARSAPALPLAEVRLETPVPWPNKIIAYPTNYRDHAAEMSTTTHAISRAISSRRTLRSPARAMRSNCRIYPAARSIMNVRSRW
jgi:hypothetical protein